MYFVKYGVKYLHDPRMTNFTLMDLTLEGEANSCGFCDFTIYPNHPMYNQLRERDADNPIEVWDDDILLFSGFIYELGKEFYLEGKVKCKGELDYLSDSIVRPYSTLQRGFGDRAPDTINRYFEWLIEQHNAQVKNNKKFVVGVNQASYLSKYNYIYRENDSYPKTIDEISEMLINNESIGGFIRTRHVNGVRVIDYISKWNKTNSQLLDFGKNLTDYSQVDDSSAIATCIVPLGAKMSETAYSYNDGYYITEDTTPDATKTYYTLDENGFRQCSELTEFEAGVTYYEYFEDYDESNLPLTLAQTMDQTIEDEYVISGDMICHLPSIKKYGKIVTTYSNQDIFDVNELVQEGLIALKENLSPKRTIEIKAVDMHMINPEIKPIRIGEYVRVRSEPHNLDSYFLCSSISLDLNNPDDSSYTLGTTFDTLTGQHDEVINKLNATINKRYEAAEDFSAEVEAAAQQNSQMVMAIRSQVAQVNTIASNAQEEATQAAETALLAQTAADNATAQVTLIQSSVQIDSDEVNIRSGNDILASFRGNGIEFEKPAVFTADGILINNGDAYSYLGRNNILWSHANGWYMNASQSIQLSANITRQMNGVVFAWCKFNGTVTENTNWKYFFVPKSHSALRSGEGIMMSDPYLGLMKYLYISNSSATGHDMNATTGTSNGIAYNNRNYTLRYVIGV